MEASTKHRIQILCATCGSTDVSRDAWAQWDVAAQEWVLRSVYDHAHCNNCDSETRLVEVQLTAT